MLQALDILVVHTNIPSVVDIDMCYDFKRREGETFSNNTSVRINKIVSSFHQLCKHVQT